MARSWTGKCADAPEEIALIRAKVLLPLSQVRKERKQHDNDLDAFRGQGAVHFEQHAGIQGSDSQTTGRLRDVQSSTRA